MPKVSLDELTIEHVEFDLPEQCPNKECNVSFTNDAEMNLIEHQLVSDSTECYFDNIDGEASIELGETVRGHGGFTIYSTGYACKRCSTIIVSTET